MPYHLVLNSSNVIGINNSQYKYNFINGNFVINEDSEMCVSQIVIPYSWFNINNSYYNNATLQYHWYYGNGLFNVFTIVFPDGFYSVNDLNNYIALYMINQNQYFYNATTGLNLYFIQLVTNITYYSYSFILIPVPSSLPSGYSLPSNVVNGYTYSGFNCNTTTAGILGSTTSYYPNVSYTYTPQFSISTRLYSSNIGSIIGFSCGVFQPSSSFISASFSASVRFFCLRII